MSDSPLGIICIYFLFEECHWIINNLIHLNRREECNSIFLRFQGMFDLTIPPNRYEDASFEIYKYKNQKNNRICRVLKWLHVLLCGCHGNQENTNLIFHINFSMIEMLLLVICGRCAL